MKFVSLLVRISGPSHFITTQISDIHQVVSISRVSPYVTLYSNVSFRYRYQYYTRPSTVPRPEVGYPLPLGNYPKFINGWISTERWGYWLKSLKTDFHTNYLISVVLASVSLVNVLLRLSDSLSNTPGADSVVTVLTLYPSFPTYTLQFLHLSGPNKFLHPLLSLPL